MMARYTCWMFDRAGVFVAEHDIERRDDDSAVNTARRLFQRSRFEVFRGDTKIYPLVPILKVVNG